MLKFVKLFSHYFFKKFLLLRQSITPLPGLQLHTLEVALYCLTSHCVPIFFSLSVLYFIAYIEQFSRTLILFPGVSDLLFSSCTVFLITDIVFFGSNRFFFWYVSFSSLLKCSTYSLIRSIFSFSFF